LLYFCTFQTELHVTWTAYTHTQKKKKQCVKNMKIGPVSYKGQKVNKQYIKNLYTKWRKNAVTPGSSEIIDNHMILVHC